MCILLAGYDTEFVKNGQRYNYNFTNGDPYRDPSKRYIGDEGPLGNALQAVLFGIRGAVEGAGKLAIDTPLELINQAPRMLDAVAQAGTYPIREIMRALGFEPPEHEVPESISGMVARTMGSNEERHTLTTVLVRPVRRVEVLLGKYLGVTALLSLNAVLAWCVLAVAMALVAGSHAPAMALPLLGLVLEAALVVAVIFLLITFTGTTVAAMGGLALWLAGREERLKVVG